MDLANHPQQMLVIWIQVIICQRNVAGMRKVLRRMGKSRVPRLAILLEHMMQQRIAKHWSP